MSLLREIQDATASNDVPVAVILRKCKILATRLKSAEFRAWVDLELNGYPNEVSVPEYRVLKNPENCGNFFGAFGRAVKNAPVPGMSLPREIRDLLCAPYELRGGVDFYEDLLANGESEGSVFRLLWPSDAVAMLSAMGVEIYSGCQCLELWRMLPRSKVVGVLSNVRDQVLNFALDIEGENPDAGDAAPNTVPIPEPVVQQIFNNHFHGAVGNVSSGGKDYSQQSNGAS